MFFVIPNDKFTSFVAKYNTFSAIYITVLLYISYLSGILYNLGKYENLIVLFMLIGLEFVKYFFYKKVHIDAKQKRKSCKLNKFFKSVFFSTQMLILMYIVSVLLGAPFLTNFEQTFMFSCLLIVLAFLPLSLYLEINDIFQLLSLASQPPKDTLNNTTLLQFQFTLFGAWLGAIPIPLDWNYEWQIWPNSCILGAFCGFFLANIGSYIMYSRNDSFKVRKNANFKSVL